MKRMSSVLAICLLAVMVSFTTGRAQESYPGIDVSEWQGEIDFGAVRQAGIEVVYIRAGEGSGYTDRYFRRNYEQAKQNGLQVGFYHYVTAISEEEARAQARFFVSLLADTQPDCKLAMDYENFHGQSRETVNRIARTFCDTVRELSGKEVVVYSNAYSAGSVFDASLAASYPLWVAEYGVNSPRTGNWSTYAGWQYTSQGRVSGISGNVDRDVFRQDIFLSDTSRIPSHQPPEQQDSGYRLYTVRSGDTLSQIALRYGVSVNELARYNGIANPNLIYVGQVLRIPGTVNSGGSSLAGQRYVVRRGDTLSEIALRFDTSVSVLARDNGIRNPNLIYPGQVLVVNRASSSGSRQYTVRRGDTLSEIALRFGTTVNQLVQLNGIANPNLIYPGQVLIV